MYYSYTHPWANDIIPKEDYDFLFAEVLDGLGITEMTLSLFKQYDIAVKKERIGRLVSASSPDLPNEQSESLVSCLYDNIFSSLDGSNFPDNQSAFTPLRSCAGQLQSVVEDYLEKNPEPLTGLSVIGTMNAEDFAFLKVSMTQLLSLDLSDAIPIGTKREDYYVIPERALFREDGELKLELLNLHDSTLKIGADAFRNCKRLDIVFLSKTLKEIGPSAFRGCSNLSKLVLPKTLKVIGDNAFLECAKLKSILCIGTEPASLGTDSFTHKEESRLVIPVGAMDTYAQSPWSELFANLFEDDMGDMDNYRKIKDVRKNHIGYTREEKRAVIRMMQAMSHSDNMPHYSEDVLIHNIGTSIFEFTDDEVDEAKRMDIPDAVSVLIRMSSEKKEDLLKKVEAVAEADGGFTSGEKALYQLLKTKL